jgi:acetoin:2,6-dichlorophenolindophenol oxidoreductase subunit alpha
VSAVRETALEVVSRVRSGGGPEFVEARTYRFAGHSRSDPGKYRPEGELDRWRERDPLTVTATLLRERLGAAAEEVARVEAEVDEELNRVQDEALRAPFPAHVEIPEFNNG